MNEADVSTKLRVALASFGAVSWKVSDRFHASRPDLLVFRDGVCSAIEMKIFPSVPTGLQKLTLEQLVNVGTPTYVGSYNKTTKVLTLTCLNDNVMSSFANVKEAAKWLLERNSSSIKPKVCS